MPDLYIISGSNGAGKSTIGQDYVPTDVLADSSIFDGDKLYMQKHLELWKSGMRVDKKIKEIANDFVFYGNLDQLNRNFKLLDSLLIFDTSTTAPFLLAKMIDAKLELTAAKDKLPDWFINTYRELCVYPTDA